MKAKEQQRWWRWRHCAKRCACAWRGRRGPVPGCTQRSKGGVAARGEPPQSVHGVRFLCSALSPGSEALREVAKPLPQPWIRRRGGAAQRERSASATTYCAQLPIAIPALQLPARARGCRRRSGDSKEGLSGGSGRFAAVARASGGQEVAQRGHRCLCGEGRAVANLYFRIS